jgi:hypothetical protein
MRIAWDAPSSSLLSAEVFLARQDIKLGRWAMKRLHRRNLRSRSSVVGNASVHVSLTTYGERLRTVYLTLESIGAGDCLPSRFILWLDDPVRFRNRPDSLRRLEDRGLEIRLTENLGAHKKYYPYLLATDPLEVPLATADDDALYTRWWLSGLLHASGQNPAAVHCYRAHVIRVADGVIQPYRTWTPCLSTVPSYCNFATGVSGCIYPPSLQARIKAEGSAFRELCPTADDIWLHVNALRYGYRVKQILPRPMNFPEVPGTQSTGLFQTNAVSGNDEQLCRVYTREDIAQILAGDDLASASVETADQCLLKS